MIRSKQDRTPCRFDAYLSTHPLAVMIVSLATRQTPIVPPVWFRLVRLRSSEPTVHSPRLLCPPASEIVNRFSRISPTQPVFQSGTSNLNPSYETFVSFVKTHLIIIKSERPFLIQCPNFPHHLSFGRLHVTLIILDVQIDCRGLDGSMP